MWQAIASRTISLLSFIGFLLLSLALLVVTGTLSLNLFIDVDNGRIISIVLIAVIATAVFLFNLAFFQILHYFASKNSRQSYQTKKDKWLEKWNEVLWNDAQVPKTHELIAAEALLEMAENMSLDYQSKFQEIYKESGLLAYDLRTLKYNNLSEDRARALEHLAIIADTGNTKILEKEIKNPILELSILALFALAKTYAKAEVSSEKIIEIFVPIIDSDRFSMGIIEEALVLLEDNAKDLLYYLSRPTTKEKQVRASLAAIGYFANLEWAEWCVPWLSSFDPETQAAALKALVNMRYVPAHAYSEIYKALESPKWFVRNQAVNASIGVLSEKINEYLVKAISDEAWWVRYNAASVLAQKGKSGQSLLKQIATSHEDPYARDIAKHFLG